MTADRPPADVETLLLEFVRDRDMPCPLCGYNLRNLTTPTCPECHETLVLSVGFARPRLGWFIAAIIPGFFSVIAAGLMLIPLVGSLLSANPPAPWPVWATDAFGWLSGLVAIALVQFRHGFLQLPQAVQRGWALGIWAVHLLAFVALMAFFALK